MNREAFQEAHGQQMGQILRLPAITQGLLVLALEITEGITNLRDEQIRDSAAMLLADYRGRLRGYKNLLTLPIIEDHAPTPQLTEEYPDSVIEAWEQETRKFEQTHHKP